jgi:hypothetical protein
MYLKAILKDFLFVGKGDYHLKSLDGYYIKNGYVKDSVSSLVLFPTYELGRYANTPECSVHAFSKACFNSQRN